MHVQSELPFCAFVGTVHAAARHAHRSLSRAQGNASTKTRADVAGGGRKPYKQKGTGRARQGSRTSPLLRGGGVVFGPKPKDWSIDMNRKERRLAMATALQSAARDIVAVDSFAPVEETQKTKTLVEVCKGVGVDPMAVYTLLITAEHNEKVFRAGRNIGRMQINNAHNLRIYDVLRADKIIVEAAALDTINSRFNGGGEANKTSSGGGDADASATASEPASALEPGGEGALEQLGESAERAEAAEAAEPAPKDAEVIEETAEVAPSAAPEADADDPKEATQA